MIECCDVLNCIDELLFEVIDQKNNIIYPKDNEKIKIFEKLTKTYSSGSVIHDQNTNNWYKYEKRIINKEDKVYTLRYLINITELEEKYQTDPLTTVLSRATILDKLKKEIIECIKNNTQFSIVIGDIDFFKKINDTYGHVAGDLVLKKIGKIFNNQVENTEHYVGRYGGEEFLFIFKNLTLDEVVENIKEIKQQLDNLEIQFKTQTIKNITMSFGIYYIKNLNNEDIVSLPEKERLREIINAADMALYESKNTGRNKSHAYYENGIIEEINY